MSKKSFQCLYTALCAAVVAAFWLALLCEQSPAEPTPYQSGLTGPELAKLTGGQISQLSSDCDYLCAANCGSSQVPCNINYTCQTVGTLCTSTVGNNYQVDYSSPQSCVDVWAPLGTIPLCAKTNQYKAYCFTQTLCYCLRQQGSIKCIPDTAPNTTFWIFVLDQAPPVCNFKQYTGSSTRGVCNVN
jgi:hypothetical protein